MTARWRVGFQFADPGTPITAACSGSAPLRFLARTSAPRPPVTPVANADDPDAVDDADEESGTQ